MTVLDRFAAGLIEAPGDRAEFLRAAVSDGLVDIVGAWIAGRTTTEAQDLAPGPLAPLGRDLFDRVARAVATVRLTETDDIHLLSCITAGAIVVPTALRLAKAFGSSPDAFNHAVAAGYEAMIRFSEAVRGPDILYRGIWPTYLSAPLGTAAVTSVLLGLDATTTADALAIALAQTSGAPGQSTRGRNPRWLLAGLAARAGCVAAVAAHHGFGGDHALLDGDWLARTHGLACEPEALAKARSGMALGDISRKPVCAARQTIASIEGFSTLLAGANADSITAVRVHVPTIYRAMIQQPPRDRMGRIASVAYQLALAAYRPDDLLDIERAAVDDPRLAAFMTRVEVLADPTLDAFYPKRWPARVEIDRHDGPTASLTITAARGDPERPLSGLALDNKFRRLVGPSFGGGTDALLSLCRGAASDADVLRELGRKLDAESDA